MINETTRVQRDPIIVNMIRDVTIRHRFHYWSEEDEIFL